MPQISKTTDAAETDFDNEDALQTDQLFYMNL